MALGDGGLLFVTGNGLLTTYPLFGDEVVIGRDPSCDVVVGHESLSRRHAALRLCSRLTVQDLGSTNGTRVARKTLHGGEPVPLAIGESFHIGRLSFVVLRGSQERVAESLSHDGSAMLHVLDPTIEGASGLVRDVARSGVNVLILGETGVGKEVLAQTVHTLSGRKGLCQGINCAALSAALLESELFGHEKGAFTGADQRRIGLLEAAAGGTVLLDEVGELPATVQAKLLRVIETREVLRVGAVRSTTVDVRFLAATHRNLPSEVASGQFRPDLYYRLDGVSMTIAPLRERSNQIGVLAMQFLREALERQDPGKPLKLATDFIPRLQAHTWPGNVRELKAVAERALLLARGGEVGARHIALTPTAVNPVAAARQQPPDGAALTPAETAERTRIIDALEACAGNQTRAARQLGISRATLVTKLAIYRIPRPRE